ncbi:biotin carboxyl carrier domain-containing protein [Labrys sp. LIt4]|uniref:Biotin carboxyl carrier protein of acetyl-CoA carboxylase n=1 Tax=Labrys okinawensis TaxID=346911 RepID=A0A2S9QJI6_9HYPH|nr:MULTISPECIES: acetyl-CoA carboxylase [Labrys]MBP0580298.1 biotin carboxyl carrier domain-containing protein [Labrys sp. LIt4]PRH89452.1 biotin carboxyl carrier domain-containing protein [Labrys okinawensis]
MAILEIMSPLPGVFYRRPSPDSPAFKEDGESVAAADVIGLVEVMKSFHEVHAGIGGANIKFLVDDGDAVMAGQALAEVEA